MLSIDLWSILATIVNILVLCLVVKFFLLKPIHNIWKRRQDLIDGQLQNASDTQAKANELKAQYEEQLSGAKETSQQMVEQAKADAKAEYDRASSRKPTKRLPVCWTTPKRALIWNGKNPSRQAEGQIAALAVDAAAKMMGQTADEKHNQELYNQFLAQAGDTLDESDSNRS